MESRGKEKQGGSVAVRDGRTTGEGTGREGVGRSWKGTGPALRLAPRQGCLGLAQQREPLREHLPVRFEPDEVRPVRQRVSIEDAGVKGGVKGAVGGELEQCGIAADAAGGNGLAVGLNGGKERDAAGAERGVERADLSAGGAGARTSKQTAITSSHGLKGTTFSPKRYSGQLRLPK